MFLKIFIFPHMHIIMWEFSKKNSTFFREKDHQPFFSAHTRKKYWLEWEVRIISQGDAVKLNKSYCITDRHICLAIFKTEILMMRKVDLRSFYMSEKILKLRLCLNKSIFWVNEENVLLICFSLIYSLLLYIHIYLKKEI